MFTAALITTAKTWKQRRCPLTDKQIKKLWCVYTKEYDLVIKRNISESFLMSWMNLEPIIQSEVSQKEKNKYCVLMHVYGIQKDGADEPICRAETETQTENRLMDMDGWGRKERVRLMKRVDGSIHYQM